MMDKQGKIFLTTGLLVKLIGALVGSLGLFLTAFDRTIVGAAFVGLGVRRGRNCKEMLSRARPKGVTVAPP